MFEGIAWFVVSVCLYWVFWLEVASGTRNFSAVCAVPHNQPITWIASWLYCVKRLVVPTAFFIDVLIDRVVVQLTCQVA
jgi:hypothetical protein